MGGTPSTPRPDGTIIEAYQTTGGRTRHRVVDTLGIMLRAGTITQDEHDAGRRFGELFTRAMLAIHSASRLTPHIRGHGDQAAIAHGIERARRHLHEALTAIGGPASLAGDCIWHVVGLQCSIREWAIRRRSCGDAMTPRAASATLVHALRGICAHWR